LTPFKRGGLTLAVVFFLNPGLQAATATTPNLKVAFIGDTAYGSSFVSVLNLVKTEGAQVVLHQGDFDYVNDANGFFSKVTSVLGANFPYLASVGNHDYLSWAAGCSDPDGCYATSVTSRMAANGLRPDDPNLDDEKYAVVFRGLKIVFIGQNGNSAEFAQFINDQFTGDDHIWKVSSWHKDQQTMQIGGKTDEMGWEVYENSRKMGAIIATAHEHSYERTLTLTSTINKTVDTTQHPLVGGVPTNPNNLLVTPGKTFVFVSGLGGNSIRNQDLCLPTTYPYGGGTGCNYIWANIYTSDQGAQYGALFITFYVDGDPYKARGYFKNISGQVIDAFEIRSTPSGARCDLNGDSATDAVDLQLLVNAILAGSTSASYDINRDAQVNVVDLQTLANVALGKASCPP